MLRCWRWMVLGLLAASGTVAAAALPPGLQNVAGELNAVPQVVLPSLDAAAFKAQLAADKSTPQPYIVGSAIFTDLLPADGLWEPLNSGESLWRLRLTSAGAKSLHLRLEDVALPDGAALYVYAPGGSDVRGPYTAADLTPDGKLWTPVVAGEQLVVELVAPHGARDAARFRITNVYYGFEEFWKEDSTQFKEGNCHVDMVCPAAADFRREGRSVGRIQFDIPGLLGTLTGLCTGQLINNTAGDGKRYFLTANHCISTQLSADSVVAYWNYQKSSCGGANDGSLNDTQTGGARLRATSAGSDFTLLEYNNPLNVNSNLHFTGWDRSEAAPGSAFTIHHPGGTEKRISFENNPLQVTSFGGTSSPGDGNALRVVDWDLGSTEQGSSGAGLWNGAHRLVGQLSQGSSACGNNESDWYGRFARSWNGGATSGSRLREWLDPANTGASQIDGRNLTSSGGTGGSGGSGAGGQRASPVDDGGGGGGCTAGGAGNGLGLLLAAMLTGLAGRRAVLRSRS